MKDATNKQSDTQIIKLKKMHITKIKKRAGCVFIEEKTINMNAELHIKDNTFIGIYKAIDRGISINNINTYKENKSQINNSSDVDFLIKKIGDIFV